MRPSEHYHLLDEAGDFPPRHQRRKPSRHTGPAWRLVGLGAAGAISAAFLGAVIVTNGKAAGQQQTHKVTVTPGVTVTSGYTFRTYGGRPGQSFNLLFGINNGNVVAGAYGAARKHHPSRGYLVLPGGQGDFVSENFPHAAQTQINALNNKGVTVGYWAGPTAANGFSPETGFYAIGAAKFHSVAFPTTFNSNPPVNQLLGVNDNNIAVGAYIDAQGKSRGYEYNITTRTFTRILAPGTVAGRQSPSLVTSGINDLGDIAGFYVPSPNGPTVGFLRLANGQFIRIAFPGASMTKPFAVSRRREVVGAYTVGNGNQARMHGFTWTMQRGFTTVDDPHGIGATALAGVNDAGDLVGFYTDASGMTRGLLAFPSR